MFPNDFYKVLNINIYCFTSSKILIFLKPLTKLCTVTIQETLHVLCNLNFTIYICGSFALHHECLIEIIGKKLIDATQVNNL